MNELTTQIKALIPGELARAAEKHGDSFHSMHEAYGVIREEYEEVEDCIFALDRNLGGFWAAIKRDADTTAYLEAARITAIHAAAEFVQVAAMCEKAMPLPEPPKGESHE